MSSLLRLVEAGSVTVEVPAKINLQLSVGPLRPDGYHELITVFHAVDLVDRVVADSAPGGGISLQVEPFEGRSAADIAKVPTDKSNLAWQAAELLASHAEIEPDVALTIRKGIPVAGGMAGGSADAAATLVACDVLWGLGLSRDELGGLAEQLGSDVAFALHGGTAIGTGRGEVITPAMVTGHYNWVIAGVDDGLSTPAVYKEFDRLTSGRPHAESIVDEPLMVALRAGDVAAVGRRLHNDLQPAAVSLKPQLELVIQAGLDAGALGGMVSGSGPTCVFLVEDSEAALDVMVMLTGTGLVTNPLQATGPAHGARVVASES